MWEDLITTTRQEKRQGCGRLRAKPLPPGGMLRSHLAWTASQKKPAASKYVNRCCRRKVVCEENRPNVAAGDRFSEAVFPFRWDRCGLRPHLEPLTKRFVGDLRYPREAPRCVGFLNSCWSAHRRRCRQHGDDCGRCRPLPGHPHSWLCRESASRPAWFPGSRSCICSGHGVAVPVR